MIDKSKYKLDGKTNEQVREGFLQFLEQDGTKPGGYSSVGTNKVISGIVKDILGKDSILSVTDVEKANMVSKGLTKAIDEESDYAKRHQLGSLRCHVRKYIEFLEYCEVLKNKPVYDFAADPDKPFIGESNFKKIVNLLGRKKNIILEGAPGVGKTFLARKIAYQLIGEIKDENIEMVQFHQSYSYEDFIQGIRPSDDGGFTRRDGVFFEFCTKARRSLDKPFVFIIDEINRGNISKILGELMMLIEADKRSKKYAIKLTYSDDEDEKFYVPENVYIIGCMNTADRSLAIVDYALRRRFAFCPIQPEFNDTFKSFLLDKISESNADSIISRLNNVNSNIQTQPSLGKGLEIGHSYFCNLDGAEDFDQWWNDICEYELFPYLKEICFDNDDLCLKLCNTLRF